MLELVLLVLAMVSLLSLSVVLNYFNNKNVDENTLSDEETLNARINKEDCNFRSLVSCEM